VLASHVCGALHDLLYTDREIIYYIIILHVTHISKSERAKRGGKVLRDGLVLVHFGASKITNFAHDRLFTSQLQCVFLYFSKLALKC